ncbi:hypothetical protein V1478_002875 [Vespula squamosa]|uniref:Uncharacterized protein n=1 Tax=Vespula squamosa TaxID=30214 RepID=A0ABD2BRL9_VESSQ
MSDFRPKLDAVMVLHFGAMHRYYSRNQNEKGTIMTTPKKRFIIILRDIIQCWSFMSGFLILENLKYNKGKKQLYTGRRNACSELRTSFVICNCFYTVRRALLTLEEGETESHTGASSNQVICLYIVATSSNFKEAQTFHFINC